MDGQPASQPASRADGRTDGQTDRQTERFTEVDHRREGDRRRMDNGADCPSTTKKDVWPTWKTQRHYLLSQYVEDVRNNLG